MRAQLLNPPLAIGNPVINGSGGSVLFVDANKKLGQDTNFQWDTTDGGLRINVAAPIVAEALHIAGTSNSNPIFTIDGANPQTNDFLITRDGGVTQHKFLGDGGMIFNEAGNDSDVRMEGDTATQLFVTDASTDSVEIGTTTQGTIAKFGSSIIFNEEGADRDFRVEGDTEINLFFVDASTDRVGFGTASPTVRVEVLGKATDTGLLMLDHGSTDYTGTASYFGMEADIDITTAASNAGVNATAFKMDVLNAHVMNGSTTVAAQQTIGYDSIVTANATHSTNTVVLSPISTLIGFKSVIDNKDIHQSPDGGQSLVTGLDLLAKVTGAIDSSGQTLTSTVTGAKIVVENSSAITDGSITKTTHGVFLDVSSTSEGTSTSFGIFSNDHSGGDTMWHFYMQQDVNSWHRGQFAIGGTAEITPDSMLEVETDAASVVGVHIKGAASQSGNLLTLTDSSDAIFFSSGDGLASSEVVWNEQGADIDFRVEGDTEANLFFVDASADDVLIGNTTAANADISFSDGGATVFNEQGNDADFRIEGDTEANLFFVDASTNRIGMFTSSPDVDFHIEKLDAVFRIGSAETRDDTPQIQLVGGDNTSNSPGRISFFEKNVPGTLRELIRLEAHGGNPSRNHLHIGLFTGGAGGGVFTSDMFSFDASATVNNSATFTAGTSNGVADARMIFYDTSGGGTTNNIRIGNMATPIDTNSSITFESYLTNRFRVRIIARATAANDTSGQLIFQTNKSGTTNQLTEVMRLTHIQLVGINVTDADAMLEVGTNATGEEGIKIKGTASQTADLFLMTDSSDVTFCTFGDGLTSSEIRFNDAQVDIDFVVEGNGVDDLLFCNAGLDFVGIVEATPTSTFDVNGSLSVAIRALTSNTTLDATDHVVTCGAGNETFTVTLPASSGITGRTYHIKNVGTGTITVDGNASETIDGATTAVISAQFASIMIVCDGSNWHII